MDQIPKAEMKINPTLDEYTEASMLVERKNGSLHPLPFVVLLSAGLLFIGLCSINWFKINYSTIFFPLLICFFCPFLLFLFFVIQPRVIRKKAEKNYLTYCSIMQSSTLRLYDDVAITISDFVKLTDQYALMVLCIETPKLFVLVKDHERMLIIPKRCIPDEEKEEIIKFLRLVFARKRSVMNNWIF